MLPGEAGAASKYLQSKIHGQIEVSGNRIEIEDQKGLDVKLLPHKFLHDEGLTGYRVLSESGTVRVVLDDKPAREEKPEDGKITGVPPFPTPIDGKASADGRCIPKLYHWPSRASPQAQERKT